MCDPETLAIGSSVTVQLELIQDQLKELSAQRSLSSAPVGRSDDRPLRSPSPRRVRFDDRASDTRPRSDNDRRSDDVSRARYYNRSMSPPSDVSFSGRGTTRGYRTNRFTASPNQYWRNDNYQQQHVFGQQRGRGAYKGRARPYVRDNTPAKSWPGGCGNQTCGKCGRRVHSHPKLCPAINLNYRCCGRKGHFLRVCRSSVSNQMMSD